MSKTPTTTEILTCELRDGRTVLGVDYHGKTWPKTYGNRTQAHVSAAKVRATGSWVAEVHEPMPGARGFMVALTPRPVEAPEPAKSQGHLCFHEGQEFYERGGEVYRAGLENAFEDGYRQGRWECSRQMFDRFRAVIAPSSISREIARVTSADHASYCPAGIVVDGESRCVCGLSVPSGPWFLDGEPLELADLFGNNDLDDLAFEERQQIIALADGGFFAMGGGAAPVTIISRGVAVTPEDAEERCRIARTAAEDEPQVAPEETFEIPSTANRRGPHRAPRA